MTSEELEQLEQAAASGDANAYFELGVAYSRGDGVAEDGARAAQHLQAAVNLGHPRAMNHLGIMMIKGTQVPFNVPVGVRLLQAAGDAGDVQALFNLGLLYKNGTVVARDHAQARVLLELARRAGHPKAAQALADLPGPALDTNPGVTESPAQLQPDTFAHEPIAEQPVRPGKSWAKRVIIVILIAVMGSLAGLLFVNLPIWVERNDKKISATVDVLYQQRVHLRFAEARQTLEELNRSYPASRSFFWKDEGEWLDKWESMNQRRVELEAALAKVKEPVKEEELDQVFELAGIYSTFNMKSQEQVLLTDIAQRTVESTMLRRVARHAAKSFLPELHRALLQQCVQKYPDDWIARADFASAGGPPLTKEQLEVVEYQRDAERGDIIGQYNLGWAHYNGVGIPTNYPVAHRWFVKAAARGDAAAQDYLGLMHEYGQVVPKSLTEARAWYKKAADRGSDLGKLHMVNLLLDDKTAASDALALAYVNPLVAKGSDDAQFYLAFMYETGRGVPVKQAEAVRLYKLSAAQGNASAQRNLKNLGY